MATHVAGQPAGPTLIFPGLGALYSSLSAYMRPLLRLAAGLILMPHGAQKLFGWFGAPPAEVYVKFFGNLGLTPPEAWITFVGCVEFFGGLLLAIGLLTRVAAAAVTIQMAYIVFFINWANGFFWTPKAGIEYPLLWGLLAFTFIVTGGGKLSVDSALGREV